MGNADLEVCQGNRLEADNGAGNTSLGSVDENLVTSDKAMQSESKEGHISGEHAQTLV